MSGKRDGGLDELGVSIAERRRALELLALLHGGADEEEAREQLGLDRDRFRELYRTMVALEGHRLRGRSPEEIFLEYEHFQRRCIRDLEDMLNAADDKGQPSAMTGAIKARSEIFDKIFERGQQLGFIPKKPEEKRVVGGIVLANLSNAELHGAIIREQERLQELMGQWGEKAFLELSPGELYREPDDNVVDLTPRGGTWTAEVPRPTRPRSADHDRQNKARAASNKVHGGRRVVKAPVDED